MDSNNEASFVRRQNIQHFTSLLNQVTDEARRQQIQKLLAEELLKQEVAGDHPA